MKWGVVSVSTYLSLRLPTGLGDLCLGPIGNRGEKILDFGLGSSFQPSGNLGDLIQEAENLAILMSVPGIQNFIRALIPYRTQSEGVPANL